MNDTAIDDNDWARDAVRSLIVRALLCLAYEFERAAQDRAGRDVC